MDITSIEYFFLERKWGKVTHRVFKKAVIGNVLFSKGIAVEKPLIHDPDSKETGNNSQRR